MVNFLTETRNMLDFLHVPPSEIDWIGTDDGEFAMSWLDFCDDVKEFQYDPSQSQRAILEDLIVKFKDGSWLSREKVGWIEVWIYNSKPELSQDHKPLHLVHGVNELGQIYLDREEEE